MTMITNGTNTLYQQYDPHSNYPRANNAILRPILYEFQQVNEDDDSDHTIQNIRVLQRVDGYSISSYQRLLYLFTEKRTLF